MLLPKSLPEACVADGDASPGDASPGEGCTWVECVFLLPISWQCETSHDRDLGVQAELVDSVTNLWWQVEEAARGFRFRVLGLVDVPGGVSLVGNQLLADVHGGVGGLRVLRLHV